MAGSARVVGGAVWVLLLDVLTGCSSSGEPLPEIAPAINQTLATGPHRLAPGDLLEVHYPGNAEWSHEVRVRPDGCVSTLFHDSMFVSGLSMDELDQRLTALQGDRDERTQGLSVRLKEASRRSISVIGEVLKPGELTLHESQVSLVEALARAGGPRKETAELDSVILVRHRQLPPSSPGSRAADASGGTPLFDQWVWMVDASHEYWGDGTPLYLQANDVVFVPNTTIDKLDIWVDQYIRQLLPIPGAGVNRAVTGQ